MYKEITAKKLIELLGKLPPETFLSVNTVGNLMLISDKGYIGYIDFLSEEVSLNS